MAQARTVVVVVDSAAVAAAAVAVVVAAAADVHYELKKMQYFSDSEGLMMFVSVVANCLQVEETNS